MTVIDWEAPEHSYEEILLHFLEGNTGKYSYSKDVCSNELEQVIYGMIDSVSSEEANVMNLQTLDEMGITGERLVKLWILCRKNPSYFKKTVVYITGTYLTKAFTPQEVLANLDLDDPFEFIPDDKSLKSLQSLGICMNRGEMPKDDYDKIIFSLRSSLVTKYNKFARNHEEYDLELLPEVSGEHRKVL